MSEKWTLAEDAQQLALMGAASRLIDSNRTVECPVCHGESVRFYYHEFGTVPRRRGTIWIWCGRMRKWDHVSRVELPPNYGYDDPFSNLSIHDFDFLEKAGLLDRIDQMWEEGKIPHSFSVKSG